MPLLSPEMANKVCFNLHKTIYPFQKDMYMGLNSISLTLPSSGEISPGTLIEPEGCVYLKIGASPVETPLNDPGKFPDRLFRVRSFSHNKDLKGSTETRCKGMFFLEELDNNLIFGPNFDGLMHMADKFKNASVEKIQEYEDMNNALNRIRLEVDSSFWKASRIVNKKITESKRFHVIDKVKLYIGGKGHVSNSMFNAFQAEIVKELIDENTYSIQTSLFKEVFGE